VVGIVGIAQQPAADAQYHRAVAAHQLGERGFVPLPQEAGQELAVGLRVGFRPGRVAQLPDDVRQGSATHVASRGSPTTSMFLQTWWRVDDFVVDSGALLLSVVRSPHAYSPRRPPARRPPA